MSQIKKIEKLTHSQEIRFKEFIDKWTAIGLSTMPANKKSAEDGINNAYKIIGLNPPKKIVWCGSPFSQALTRAIIFEFKKSEIKIRQGPKASVGDSMASVMTSVMVSIRDSVRDRVRDSVMTSVGTSVWDSVWNSVGDSVMTSIRDSVWGSVMTSIKDSVRNRVEDSVGTSVGTSVGDSVMDSVGDSVMTSIRDSVRDRVRDSVMTSIRDSVRNSGYGQHDANWLAFYDYFRIACGLEEETKKLTGIFEISKNAGWWLPHENICWISERHNILKRNRDGRLHADGEMALQYPDGWGIYAFNGVRLPEKYGSIKQDKWESKWILEEKNAELRRILIQGIGYGKIVRDLNPKLVDSWKEYELLKIENIDVEPIMMVKMICPSTGLLHAHRVPPDMDTARNAIKWVNCGVDQEEFLIER